MSQEEDDKLVEELNSLEFDSGTQELQEEVAEPEIEQKPVESDLPSPPPEIQELIIRKRDLVQSINDDLLNPLINSMPTLKRNLYNIKLFLLDEPNLPNQVSIKPIAKTVQPQNQNLNELFKQIDDVLMKGKPFLFNDEVVPKKFLLQVKLYLQGKTQLLIPTIADRKLPVSSKQSNQIKPVLAKGKGSSLKSALLGFALFLIGGIAVIYIISRFIGGV